MPLRKGKSLAQRNREAKIRMQLKRENETPQAKQSRLEYDRKSKSEVRRDESPCQKCMRLQTDKKSKKQNRAEESPTVKHDRLTTVRKSMRYANDTYFLS